MRKTNSSKKLGRIKIIFGKEQAGKIITEIDVSDNEILPAKGIAALSVFIAEELSNDGIPYSEIAQYIMKAVFEGIDIVMEKEFSNE
jgi:hypothetical protein